MAASLPAKKQVQLTDVKFTLAGSVIGVIGGATVASKYHQSKWLCGIVAGLVLGVIGAVVDGYMHDAALRNSGKIN